MAIQGSLSASYPSPVTLSWLRATLHNNLDSVSAVSNTVQCSHFRLWVTLSFHLSALSPRSWVSSHYRPQPLRCHPRTSRKYCQLEATSPCLSSASWHLPFAWPITDTVSQTAVSCQSSSSSWECKQLRESISEACIYLLQHICDRSVFMLAHTRHHALVEVKRQSSGVTYLLPLH